jgi:hypothetical protein
VHQPFPDFEDLLADGSAAAVGATPGVWHARASDLNTDAVVSDDALADALRDKLTEQLVGCATSLIVIWDAGGERAMPTVAWLFGVWEVQAQF